MSILHLVICQEGSKFPVLLNPIVGLIVSFVVLLFLIGAFVFLKPKIFVIFGLKSDDLHKEIMNRYPIAMFEINEIVLKNEIKDWRTFFIKKRDTEDILRNKAFSSAGLRRFIAIRTIIQALFLLVCYSFVIMYGCAFIEANVLHHSKTPEFIFSFRDYVYQVFGLFLSVSTITVLTSTIEGTCVLLGQFMIYFVILVGAVKRINDALSMQSLQTEILAHNFTVMRLKI